MPGTTKKSLLDTGARHGRNGGLLKDVDRSKWWRILGTLHAEEATVVTSLKFKEKQVVTE
jgi:hypothetical protein